MTASLQTKNDRFYVVLNWNEDGKRKQKWVNTELPVKGNKRKAEAMMRDIQSEWEETLSADRPSTTIIGVCYEWLSAAKESVRSTTYKNYDNIVNGVFVPYFKKHDKQIADVTTGDIQKFIKAQLDRGISARSVCAYVLQLGVVFHYAIDMEYLDKNPIDRCRLPRVETRNATIYDTDELNALISASKGTRLETPILLASMYGLRAGEVCGLRFQDIDYEKKRIYIRGVVVTIKDENGKQVNVYRESPKTNSSVRMFELTDKMADYFKQKEEDVKHQKEVCGSSYEMEWDGFICVGKTGHPLMPQHLSASFHRFLLSHKMRLIRFHDLRHSNATLLFASGASLKEIQGWLGHSKITTTANIYVHLKDDANHELVRSVDSLIKVDNGVPLENR